MCSRPQLKNELGWELMISFDKGARQTIEWYKSHDEWLASVRGCEYQSYYEKYYDIGDSALHAIAQSKPKSFPIGRSK